MPTNFPGALDSYTNKVDGVDTVQAAHVNNLQDAVVAIETLLGAGGSNGSFTPQLKFGGGNVGMTGTFNGRYSKFGNAVWIAVYVFLSAVGSSTGNATISLPFTASGAVKGVMSAGWWLSTNQINVLAITDFNAATASLKGVSAGTTLPSDLTHAAFAASTGLWFSGVYYL